jgi:RND family efflux transporter MFP subunit
MMLLKKFSFYLALAGIIGTFVLVKRLQQTPPAPPPDREPARTPFVNTVAATGLIESVRENVKIAAPKGGLIQKIFADVGKRVKAGDVLMQLDDRMAHADIATMQAQVNAMSASLSNEIVLKEDAEDQFKRVDKLEQQNVASDDERTRKKYSLQSMIARVNMTDANLKSAQSQLASAQTNLEILTIKAPRDGTILQVNVREGEYAGTSPAEPLMILGDTDKLQLRADVDEQNAPLIKPGQPAEAYLKGDTQNAIKLRFIRIEPFVVPKKSLTGESTERVDTRVLQIVFEFDRPSTPVYVGQQMDVFIQRAPDTQTMAGKVN